MRSKVIGALTVINWKLSILVQHLQDTQVEWKTCQHFENCHHRAIVLILGTTSNHLATIQRHFIQSSNFRPWDPFLGRRTWEFVWCCMTSVAINTKLHIITQNFKTAAYTICKFWAKNQFMYEKRILEANRNDSTCIYISSASTRDVYCKLCSILEIRILFSFHLI
jgi:hypothetical protein